ncbi:MAG: hypothetical protein LH702_31560 [Phormidesmis sp. CAN_BIN44]|nr:hypothetical protein [Phormidesmis sp. CAN_BIN44]
MESFLILKVLAVALLQKEVIFSTHRQKTWVNFMSIEPFRRQVQTAEMLKFAKLVLVFPRLESVNV